MGQIHRHRPDLIRTWRDDLWQLLAANAIDPAIAATYPLDQAAAAYDHLASRTSLGKIVLKP
jgi:NADPH2:quinone reductase